MKRINDAIEYTQAPERFLFGSDWQPSSLPTYRDFVRRLFAEKDRPAVCGGTAKKLFGL